MGKVKRKSEGDEKKIRKEAKKEIV